MLRSVTRRTARARLPIAALAVALAATLTGCGLLGGDDDGGTANPGPGGLEKTQIKVGTIPVVDVAPLHYAIDNGYFKAEGLEVTAEVVKSGHEALNGIMSGTLDITFSTYAATFTAQSKRIADFKVVADGLAAKPNHLMVVATPNSKVKKATDLPGKKVAITAQNTFTDLAPMAVMNVQGIDYSEIEWISMGLPQMLPAMLDGSVDAAVVVEPWVTKAMKEAGAVPVLDAASGPTAELPMSGYIAVAGPGKFATTSPNTIAAFQRALARAQAEATDRSKMEPMFVKYAKIDEPTARLVTIATYSTTLEANRLQRVANLLEQFGAIKGKLEVAPMIISSPASG
ncbi:MULTISPECIES: ABC transporter substrate-binding protein [Actinokineospora]|uniref:Sulfonate ABC transporter substrate-binding protein n=1 Tax=Actinokineospora fastidiosa TaxID=1816 RepID=A0A918G3W6_9PSEU|nr:MULTISPECIES: ABC transporter substrate-binding protein [Actinokineospora]UVS76776.1 Putative aliphatic sulfonates-binding protein precursor [Actinokineospora sp. UTMC 2448]GGS15837.1 sulfonate ABC transporter substrate-binding protein [Actinokineospora fastidiosa]